MIKNESQRATRSHQAKIPGLVLYWEIDAAGEVTHHKKHPNLVIPFRTLFDLDHANATNTAISKEYMKPWALHIFKELETR